MVLSTRVKRTTDTKEIARSACPTILRRIEQCFFCCGGVLLLAVMLLKVDAVLAQRLAIAEFATRDVIVENTSDNVDVGEEFGKKQVPDKSLWSAQRRDAFRVAVSDVGMDSDISNAIAMLTIPQLNLGSAVFATADQRALNRGLGHIVGTSLPGGDGNVGIAGHRDSFFRSLKDIERGEDIYLKTHEGRQHYRVSDINIVTPSDVWVLEPTALPALTLVTCYPFYFVGNAPQRFVVTAYRVEGEYQ